MITFKQKCFVVSNGWNENIVIGYFLNEDDAYLVKGNDTDLEVKPIEFDIKICETRAEHDGITPYDERQKALKKLTDREKRLLGINPYGIDAETELMQLFNAEIMKTVPLPPLDRIVTEGKEPPKPKD